MYASWTIVRISSSSSGRASRITTRPSSDELLLDHPDRARRGADEVERRDLLQGGVEACLRALVHDHHQAGVVAEAALDDALDGDLVAAQHVGDLGEHAGAVGDLEVKVERRADVVDDLQLATRLVHGSLAGEDRDQISE